MPSFTWCEAPPLSIHLSRLWLLIGLAWLWGGWKKTMKTGALQHLYFVSDWPLPLCLYSWPSQKQVEAGLWYRAKIRRLTDSNTLELTRTHWFYCSDLNKRSRVGGQRSLCCLALHLCWRVFWSFRFSSLCWDVVLSAELMWVYCVRGQRSRSHRPPVPPKLRRWCLKMAGSGGSDFRHWHQPRVEMRDVNSWRSKVKTTRAKIKLFF